MGVGIYGISRDTPEENRRWVEATGFSFPLLSDPDGSVMRSFGAERDPGERFAEAPRRITYVIDPDRVIRRSYLVARDEIAEHAGQVVADLERELGGG